MSDVPADSANFCFPVRMLENERLRLEPFEFSKHAEGWIDAFSAYPEVFEYVPMGPYGSVGELRAFYESTIAGAAARTWFAVVTRTAMQTTGGSGAGDGDGRTVAAAGTVAGSIGLLNASAADRAVEVGYVFIAPPFQRTAVGTAANGLLLRYLLDAPQQGGLGLRRVQWQANASNERSVAAAQRLGYHLEGIARWQRVLPPEKRGVEGRPEGEDEEKFGPGRHSAVLSICWDDWVQGGKREHVMALMAR